MTFNTTVADTVFGYLINQIPITVTFDESNPQDPSSGDDYTATKTVLNQEIRYGDFGQSLGYQFTAIFQKSDFTTLPKTGDVMSIDSTNYRVLKTERDPADIGFRVDLGDAYPE